MDMALADILVIPGLRITVSALSWALPKEVGLPLPFGRIKVYLTNDQHGAHEVRSMHMYVDMACCEAKGNINMEGQEHHTHEVYLFVYDCMIHIPAIFDSERARCLRMGYDLLRRTGKADSHLDLMS